MLLDLYFCPYIPNQKTNIYNYSCRMLAVERLVDIRRKNMHYPLTCQVMMNMEKNRRY